MTEGSPGMNVKNRAAMFNQQNIIRTAPPPIAKKPLGGQSNGTINHVIKPDLGNTSNGVHSTAAAKKRFTPPPGAFAGIPTASSDINEIRNKLKRAPPPKAPVSEAPKDSPFPRRPSLNKPAPKPKPKPAVSPRKPVVGGGPISPTSENAKDNIPKSDVDSTSLSSFTSSESSFIPRTESSTSRTESSASRRTSGKPELQVLPPPEILGGPPPKPRKPPSSIVLPSPTAALKPANKRLSFLYKQRGSPVLPSPAAPQEEGEQEEFYDDVDHAASSPALPQPRRPRPPSLIPTMDSDEEEGEEESVDFDDLYDDTAVAPLTNLPPSLPDVGRIPPSLPDVSRIPPSLPDVGRIPPSLPDVGRIPPSLPPTDSIPHLPPSHSPFPSGQEDSGGGDFGDIYDDVSNPDEEMEELYEALDTETVEELKASDGISEASAATDENNELSAKEKEAQKKKEEKLRKEQERQQKRDEERRKKEEEKKEKERQKKEREEKKRREKEEKDAKKKFNIKGEIQVIDVGAVIEDLHPEYADKLDLSASKGDRLEILRRDGNPPGKWLVRDSEGRYGYIPESCVAVEGDSQEVYDDVAAVEGEMEDIYDSVDDH